MHNLGVAIIGTGFMGPAHTEGLRRLGINIVGVLGSSPEKSRKAAESWGLSRGYGSYQDVLDDDAVKIVHITTPNRLHYEQAVAAIEAGKHVLCEKPLAMNSEESAALVKLAAESGLAAGVNYNLRFYPLNIESQDIIRRGDLGDVLSVCGGYVQDWLLYPTDYNWRVLTEEGGKLRAIADIGTHWLDLMQTIIGLEVESVFADLVTVHPVRQRPKGEVETFSGKVQAIEAGEPINIDTEDFGAVLVRFKGGVRGSMWVSQVTAGRKNHLHYEIAGSKSAIAWDGERPNELWLGHRNKANQLLIRDPGLVSDAAREYITYPGGHNEGYDDTFKQCFKAFHNYIVAGDFSSPAPFATFADGHKEILLCEAILKSHLEGKWIKL